MSNKYYIAVIEEYWSDNPRSVSVERKGLFKTYRDASEWILDEGLEPFPVDRLWSDGYSLYFALNNSKDESYLGYVEEYEIL